MGTPTRWKAVRRAVRRTLLIVGICGIVVVSAQATAAAAPPGPAERVGTSSSDEAVAELQHELQRQNELYALLSRVAKLRHDAAKSIIDSIR